MHGQQIATLLRKGYSIFLFLFLIVWSSFFLAIETGSVMQTIKGLDGNFTFIIGEKKLQIFD